MRLTKDNAQNLLERIEEMDALMTEVVDDLIIYGDSDTYDNETRSESRQRLDEESLPQLASQCALVLAYLEPKRLKEVKP